jgi:hypothetical protein
LGSKRQWQLLQQSKMMTAKQTASSSDIRSN